MATFGILLRPFRRKSADSNPHFHAAATLLSLIPRPPPPSAISPDPSAAVLRSTSFGSRLFSPLRRRIPFSGPLFLSSPPWKLSQAASPLYFQNGEARFPRKGRFPLQLGFRASKNVRAGLTDAVRWVKPSVLVADEIRREERLFNLPNSISIGRLLSGPVIAWMIIKEWYVPAFMILGISGMTDWLDGYVARKMRIHSVIGSYLDPLADKVDAS